MAKPTLKQFATVCCDRLYEPRISNKNQCSGWYHLEMLVEQNMDLTEDNLRPFHPILREYLVKHWHVIRTLDTDSITI